MTYKGLKKIYDFLYMEDPHNIIKIDVIHAVEQTFRLGMTERDRAAFCRQVESMYDLYVNNCGGRSDVLHFVNAMYELNKRDPFAITLQDVMKRLEEEEKRK